MAFAPHLKSQIVVMIFKVYPPTCDQSGLAVEIKISGQRHFRRGGIEIPTLFAEEIILYYCR